MELITCLDFKFKMKAKCYKQDYRFLMRTVLVDNKGVNTAIERLQAILSEDMITKRAKLQESYERVSQMRNRLSHERCKRIYTREMNRKVEFVLRKNRFNPFLV